ncbi:hypothetical protein [Antarcticibacterium sp. 1MA-6-2]|uniref:hypothetical protein n=1 Tax=Antarcticibacterium sp. 1MA-6-2 TaxID=2908210 RepID=UPI0028833979|nr:hypothetical protein [Antarcticibacterium sp. 1MA-6-2]
MKKFGLYKYLFILVVGLVLINLLAANFHQRFDFTQDQRYTLSPAAKEIVDKVEASNY